MPRPAALALAAAVALASAGCAKSACQELGEKLCACQPGMTQDTCKAQVQDQLNGIGVDTAGFTGMLGNLEKGQQATFAGYCEDVLNACAAPSGANFCEWLLTEQGKAACGLTPPPAPSP